MAQLGRRSFVGALAAAACLVLAGGPREAWAMIVESAIGNFSLSPAYIQPVKFQAMRDGK